MWWITSSVFSQWPEFIYSIQYQSPLYPLCGMCCLWLWRHENLDIYDKWWLFFPFILLWQTLDHRTYILQILPKSTLIYLNNPLCQYNLQSSNFSLLSCPYLSRLVCLSLSCVVIVEGNHDHYKTVCAVEDYSIYQCVSVVQFPCAFLITRLLNSRDVGESHLSNFLPIKSLLGQSRKCIKILSKQTMIKNYEYMSLSGCSCFTVSLEGILNTWIITVLADRFEYLSWHSVWVM